MDGLGGWGVQALWGCGRFGLGSRRGLGMWGQGGKEQGIHSVEKGFEKVEYGVYRFDTSATFYHRL